MKHTNLAIIIPAYKTDFLTQVFDCIVAQTCKDFNLYVFDDASPYPVKELFDRYFKGWENARYHRFETNLGGKDLAAQWQRCVEHTKEEWVWLFSDDDLMSPECVEQIYLALNDKTAKIDDVLHFDICQIDGDNNVQHVMRPYPQNITAIEYYDLMHSGMLDTRMPEFIFRRKKLDAVGGYISFDLAWKSDNASVTAVTFPGTIYTMPQGLVSWRLSTKNVTGSHVDENGERRKRKAEIAYHNWMYHFLTEHGAHSTMPQWRYYNLYFRLSEKRWSYNIYLSDLFELMRDFDALKDFRSRISFFHYWFKMQLNETQRRYWINRIFYILSH